MAAPVLNMVGEIREEGLQSYQTLVLQRKTGDTLVLVQEMFNNVDSKIACQLKGIGMGMPIIDKITGLVTTNNPNLPFGDHYPSELLPEENILSLLITMPI